MDVNKFTKYKVLIIGNGNVGKTSLLLRYTDHTFSENTEPTIGVDFKIKTYLKNGNRTDLQIWDTAGQERFKNVTTCYYRGAHCAFLVFDLSDPLSFEGLHDWIKRLSETEVRPLLILIGNKSDLSHNVSLEKVQEFVKNYHITSYIETSAKTNNNVDTMFDTLVEKLTSADKNGDLQNRDKKPDTGKIQLHPSAMAYHNEKTCC